LAWTLEVVEFTRGYASNYNASLEDNDEVVLCEHLHATEELALKCGMQLLRVAALGCEGEDGLYRIPPGAPKGKCQAPDVDCDTQTRMGICAFHRSGRKTLRYR
jgi:hypothetical protein